MKVREVADPELGMIRQLVDDDGTVIATATMSPPQVDGTMVVYDESLVWEAGGGLMPTPEQWKELWGMTMAGGPVMKAGDTWARRAGKTLAAERAIIERACEAALQGGEYGVLVVRDLATCRLVDVRVDPSVPYGTIMEQRR